VTAAAAPSGRRRPTLAPLLAPMTAQLVWLGRLLVFTVKVIAAVPFVLRKQRKEVWRLLAEVTFGSGLLKVLASAVIVSAVLSATIGVQLGLSGLQALDLVGLAPLAGLLSSFGNTRELAPLLVAFGLAAQMGCKFTAQLGAMRVTEEIDALEVMSIPSLAYLVTTRTIAAVVAVGPLYLFALAGAYFASEVTVVSIADQGSGTYQHYFDLFLSRTDVYYSVTKVVIFAVMITILHCYYGFTATGGPEGVGVATGRAIRASIVSTAIVNMLLTLLFWGLSTPAKLTA
jgi:phospholipid/cholesterol/gamma-HCH transport system permease protein